MTSVEEIPAIFKCYPDLGDSIDYINLDTMPSQVHRLDNLGHGDLWIKRNDKLSTVYGGNKVRRLEFVLAEVLEKRKSRVVTLGAIGTNHGLATAIYCKRLGIKCKLILYDQEVTPYVRENLRLYHKYGADMVYAGNMINAGRRYYLDQRLRHPMSYFLYAGGSSPIATVGSVNAAFEFKEQLDRGDMPAPKYVICPTASNGTMGGLMLGFALAGIDTTVIGVRVGVDRWGPMEFNTPRTVKSMIRRVYKVLKRSSKMIPDVTVPEPVMLNDYVGKGYGYVTQESLRAVEIFKEKENIKLEPVYTGKTCAALLDFIKDKDRSNDTVLYWHTYNSVDLSEEARSVDYRELPPEFHTFFEE